jgi:hypothetical protein
MRDDGNRRFPRFASRTVQTAAFGPRAEGHALTGGCTGTTYWTGSPALHKQMAVLS